MLYCFYTHTNVQMIRYSPLLVQMPLFHPLLSLPAGETMRIASSEFADDPCSSVKRGTMVRAARALLSAVTRLLILADMADVMRLLSHLKIVSANMIYFFFLNQRQACARLIDGSAKCFAFCIGFFLLTSTWMNIIP